MLNYAKENPDIPIAPDNCTFEHYSDVRSDREHKKYTQEYRSLIGYMASYGGRYFDGGYAREKRGSINSQNIKYLSNLNNLKNQAPNLNGIHIECLDYKNMDIDKYHGCLFYQDPPYFSTKKYSKQSIDYEHFYQFCINLVKNDNIVLISEFYMPEDNFDCIWQRERNILQKSDRTCGTKVVEKLFICNPK